MSFEFGERPNKQKNWKGGPPYLPFEERPNPGTSLPMPEKPEAGTVPPGALVFRTQKEQKERQRDLTKGVLVRHKNSGALGIFLNFLSVGRGSYLMEQGEDGNVALGDCVVYWQTVGDKKTSWSELLEKIS